LMRRMERRRAEREKRTPRTLREIDYLLLVDDEARQGALRFAEREGGPFLREAGVERIPPLVELPRLLAAEHVMEDRDTDEDLRLLFAPGSSTDWCCCCVVSTDRARGGFRSSRQ
jgi:serine/threonine-protein kinase HipA